MRTPEQREANEMDRRLFSMADHAYSHGWKEVARALDRARAELAPKMHPADRAAVQS